MFRPLLANKENWKKSTDWRESADYLFIYFCLINLTKYVYFNNIGITIKAWETTKEPPLKKNFPFAIIKDLNLRNILFVPERRSKLIIESKKESVDGVEKGIERCQNRWSEIES